jgi:filamentous hemagglutinin
VSGSIFKDVNQTARVDVTNDPTLIADRVAAKVEATGKQYPNGTVADYNTEIGIIQQAYKEGKALGGGYIYDGFR